MPHVCEPPQGRLIHGVKADIVICSCDQTLFRRKWWGWKNQRLASPMKYPAMWA